MPEHFGDPFSEQIAYEAGRGLHPMGSLGVVSVAGPDRLSWLTTLSSQVLTSLKDGDCAELLLLDPNGRVSFAAAVLEHDEVTWLFTEAEYEAALVDFLESMKFMTRVEISGRGTDFVGFTAVNARLQQMLGVMVWDDPWPGVADGGARYFQGVHPAEDMRLRLYVVPKAQEDLFVESWLADGGELVGSLAAEATRVAMWRPLLSHEVDERSVPAELDWLRTAVHTNKGCYCGQESVARILNLGKPPRRLTFLQLDGSLNELPSEGDPVMSNGRQVGVITSVARHAEMGPIALALLKRSLDPSATLTVGDIAAAQELIVPVEGRSDVSPEVRPGADLGRLGTGGHDTLGLR